ncbi:hypothetical protein O988_00671 [Pseudogymnoascus sp. VKM F-3808]|nr:hypothetical protein O988_00671 [Pseudogymnoascus sp. VKM F-3808]
MADKPSSDDLELLRKTNGFGPSSASPASLPTTRKTACAAATTLAASVQNPAKLRPVSMRTPLEWRTRSFWMTTTR